MMDAQGRALRRERIRAGLEEPPSHGVAGYRWGCQCPVCTAANTASAARSRARRAALPSDRIPHGEGGYVNYGCRCTVCRAAGSIRNARNARNARDATRRRGAPAVARWTAAEDAVLATPGLTHRQAAEAVGRTQNAVVLRRAQLRRAAKETR